MDTGSLVDLITSVDVNTSIEIFTGPVRSLSDAMFEIVGNVIALWPTGSTAVAGSLQDVVGSVSGT